MKIGIDCGHTLSGNDYGAVGIKAESKLTREVGEKVISKLQALGHTVVKCYKDDCSSLQDSLSYRTNTANNNDVDLYVSIHFNAYDGNAHGTEVLTYGGKDVCGAGNVLNNIVALGYTNRGIKDGSNLFVLNHTKAKSMLIECCFCDNAGDMSKYDPEKIANAIVKGLAGKLPNENKTQIKEEYDMNKLVVYWGALDALSAILVAQKNKCPMMSIDDYKSSGLKAKEIIQVGGKPGTDRYDSFKDAAKLV